MRRRQLACVTVVVTVLHRGGWGAYVGLLDRVVEDEGCSIAQMGHQTPAVRRPGLRNQGWGGCVVAELHGSVGSWQVAGQRLGWVGRFGTDGGTCCMHACVRVCVPRQLAHPGRLVSGKAC